ncbi:MAG: hypothetical protein LBH88_00650 [Candidatus Methanoplasma sp.]|jgi:hypothetical protein|nr:hypothetical protein [Candidatus Methanoplasma sp.]
MKPSGGNAGTIAMVISAVAVSVSAAAAVLSIAGGDMVLTSISVISLVAFVLCLIYANALRIKIDGMKKAEEEVRCLRLKKPGIENAHDEIYPKTGSPGGTYEEDIVPKGKMPKG